MTRNAFIASLLLSLSACGPIGIEPTTGELGTVQLSWSDGFTCILGCTAEGTLATDATAVLYVHDAERLGEFTVRALDPSILDARRHDVDSLVLETGVAGDGTLEILDAEGAVLDRFTWRVVAPDALDAPDELTLVEGTREVRPVTLHAGDDRLVGSAALTYESDDPDVGEASDFVPESVADSLVYAFSGGSNDQQSVIRAVAPGEVTLALVSGELRHELALRVIAIEDVERVELVAEGTEVRATAFFEGEPLPVAPCTWEVSGPSRDSAATFGSSLFLTDEGGHEVTCVFGERSVSIETSF